MLTIKFSRKGRKKQPFYRIVVLEKAKDPRGDFLEDLGFRNPLSKETFLKKERIKYWLSQGAQPTGSVRNLLISEGIMEGEKVKVTKVNQKKFQKKEENIKAPKPQEEKRESLKEEEKNLKKEKVEKEEEVESSEKKSEERVEEKKA
jgi:small subunit ribosomal protein S16